MKKLFVFLVLLATLVIPQQSVSQTRITQEEIPQTRSDFATRGMPPRPIPAVPIPRHEPGRPFRGAQYTSRVTQFAADGTEETVTLTGLDAMLEDGVINDPLQGNRRLVSLDKALFSYFYDDNVTLQTIELTSPTSASVVPGSTTAWSLSRFYDTAVGDLNGDGYSEQLAAWILGDNRIWMGIGEMPGTFGRVTSGPAVVTHTDGTVDLLVRGYDESLWHAHNDAAWNNAGGGMLLSAPAAASAGDGTFDVFAIGSDNQVHHRHWDGASWSGAWEAVPSSEDWPPLEAWDGPTPELDAPAAVANGGQIDLFRRGVDNALKWCHFDSATWSPWTDLGGILTSGPGAIAHDGVTDVFAVGMDGALWSRSYTTEWEPWRIVDQSGLPHDVRLDSAPAVVSPGTDELSVTIRATDDRLWQLHYDGASWGVWTLAGVDKATSGHTGGALELDGVDDYIDLPDDFPDVTEFTFAAWVYWEGGPWWQRIFDFGQDTHSYVFLTPFQGTSARLAIRQDGGPEQILDASVPLTPTEWVHVAVTMDGSHARLYLNGVQDAVSAVSLTPHDVVGDNAWIGRSQYPVDPGFHGKIDEVAIFGRALDASEIATVYASGWDALIGKLLALHLDESPATHGTVLADAAEPGREATLYTLGSRDFTSAPAAVAAGTSVEIYVGSKDGHLGMAHHDGVTWADWTELGGLGVQQFYPLDAWTVTPPADGVWENLLLDMTTGTFTGDGREQTVLAYVDGGGIRMEVYDVRDGFVPDLLTELEVPIGGTAPRVAAADVDGDGVDEIGLVYVTTDPKYYQLEVYRFPDGATLDPPFYDSGPVWAENYVFAGTLRIAGGDPVPDPGSSNEEFVVVSDWYNYDVGYAHQLIPRLGVYDDDWRVGGLDGYQQRHWVFVQATDSDFGDPDQTGLALAVGDINGPPAPGTTGNDEVIVTWPKGFDGDDWPDLERDLIVFHCLDLTCSTLTEDRRYLLPGYSRFSYLDTLAVGDLDRDLRSEIVFASHQNGKYQDAGYWVDVFEYDTLTTGPVARLPLSISSAPRGFNLATGDFTGESLRVGEPSYRVQRQTGDIIAVINEPPKHVDTLDGVVYDVNSIDAGTYAAYENLQSEATEMSVQVQRDWSFAAGMETCVGNPEGTHVKNSLDTTYGEHFEYATTDLDQISFGSEVKATGDDIVYYTGKDLQVWEYPIFEDDSREPTGRIMAVFPIPGPANTGAQQYYETGNSSCDFWYAPNHQINNVWSYPDSDTQFRDYDPDRGILNTQQTVTVGPSEGEFWTQWTTVDETERSNALSQNVDTLFESQIGGDTINVSASPFGIGVSYDVHLPYVKSTIERSYAVGSMSTHSVTGSEDTTIRVHFEPISSTGVYNYEVTPYLYWARDGYLVLDYLTNPKSTTFWDLYDDPDPAFILPWADGHCAGKAQFSKDIVIDPPFANIGETVTISATVHNFSPVGVSGVAVRFLVGDPVTGTVIGTVPVDLAARDKVDVDVEWQATGIGEQRIYAVIDPDGTIPEMHDETTNPENDNNTAFGVVEIGDSGYVDPGGQVYFDYQTLTYTDTHNLPTNVYIPTAMMTETARLELTFLPDSGGLRHGFRLAAFKGGADRDALWDLVFDPAPAAVWLRYHDDDIADLDERELTLYRYDETSGWVDAACGEVLRYPADNALIVPVCRTGDFGFFNLKKVYLPLVMR